MYASIVVGTDGSATAEAALEKALELAKLTGARVHLVSAYEPARTRVTGGAPASEAYESSVGSDYKADVALQRALDRSGAQAVEVEQHAPRGDPADALLAVAKEQGAGLIVIGSVGMHGARRVFGSVPNKVSHHSPCDVLIVQTAA
jgi:nucleotide-binding universal stress UspA family protein